MYGIRTATASFVTTIFPKLNLSHTSVLYFYIPGYRKRTFSIINNDTKDILKITYDNFIADLLILEFK